MNRRRPRRLRAGRREEAADVDPVEVVLKPAEFAADLDSTLLGDDVVHLGRAEAEQHARDALARAVSDAPLLVEANIAVRGPITSTTLLARGAG